MANGNPYYIQPAGATLGQAFAPIGQALVARGQEQKAEEKLAAQQQIYSQYLDAVNSGDVDAQIRIEKENPIFVSQLSQLSDLGDSRKNALRDEMAKDVWVNNLTGQELAQKYGEKASLVGMGDIVNQAQGLGQEDLRELAAVSWAGSDSYKRFRDSIKDSTGGEKKFKQATGKGMEGWVFDESTGTFSLDKNYKNYLASDAARLANKEMLSAKDIAGVNDKITPLVKPAQEIRQAAVDLERLAINATPADQIAAVFKFMKSLDPNSAVRENEVGMIEGAEGTLKGIANMYNRMIGEGGISPEGFKQIVETAKGLANSAIDSNLVEVNKYTDVLADNMTPKQLKSIRARVPAKFEIAPQTPEKIPADLPKGTKSNGDGTYTLPSGQIVRPKSGG